MNKNIILIIFIILLVILIIIYFTQKRENNIEIGPFLNSVLAGSFIYKRAQPKRAIKNKDFREDTNAAFKVPPSPLDQPDSLSDLSNQSNNPNNPNNSNNSNISDNNP